MIRTKSVEVLTEVVDDVICNKCGTSCKGEMGNFNGLIEVVVTGAYDSTHLEDMRSYSFSICEKCLSELFGGFAINPDISGGYDHANDPVAK